MGRSLYQLEALALSFRCGRANDSALVLARCHIEKHVKVLEGQPGLTRSGNCSGPVARLASIITAESLRLSPGACAGTAEVLGLLAHAQNGQWAAQVTLGALAGAFLPSASSGPAILSAGLPALLSAIAITSKAALPDVSSPRVQTGRCHSVSDTSRTGGEPPRKTQRRSGVTAASAGISFSGSAKDFDESGSEGKAVASWEEWESTCRQLTTALVALDFKFARFRPARITVLRITSELTERRRRNSAAAMPISLGF